MGIKPVNSAKFIGITLLKFILIDLCHEFLINNSIVQEVYSLYRSVIPTL